MLAVLSSDPSVFSLRSGTSSLGPCSDSSFKESKRVEKIELLPFRLSFRLCSLANPKVGYHFILLVAECFYYLSRVDFHFPYELLGERELEAHSRGNCFSLIPRGSDSFSRTFYFSVNHYQVAVYFPRYDSLSAYLDWSHFFFCEVMILVIPTRLEKRSI